MATKRSGGGSNIGLIVTLVFFVLLSVIVSVLAYMGFDGQAALKTKATEAETKATNAEKRANWYRFQAHLYRSYMGDTTLKGEDLARLNGKASKDASGQEDGMRQKFEKGTLTEAEGQHDKDEVKTFVDTLLVEMPWPSDAAIIAPTSTFRSRLKDKDTILAGIAQSADTATAEKVKAEGDKAAAEDREGATKKLNEDLKASNTKDTDTYSKWAIAANKKIEDNQTAANERNQVTKAKDAVEDEKKKLLRTVATLQGRVDTASKDLKTARDELEDAKVRLAAIAEKSGVDLRAMQAEMLDAKAAEILKNWDRNWQIVAMDRKGTMPYVNLGSGDGLKTQVTFSVHSVRADGKLDPTPKGTVEVVRVMGAKQAQVRVTSIRDAKANPITKGDRLFNPTWDPSRKKRVAIAGLADLGGDGTDSTSDLRRLLERQSVIVDAYVDTKGEKEPRTLSSETTADGKQKAGAVTTNTDYLILADNLEQVNHAKAREKDYAKKFDDQVKKLKEQAASNGVPTIALKKYLDMIGYRAPKVTSSGTGR